MTARLWATAIILTIAVLGATWLHAAREDTPPPADALSRLLERELPDLDGKLHALSQSQGEILVVNFWATWCPPCRREIPDLSQLSQDFAGQGVRFVGISIDETDKVRAFRDEFRVPYALLIGDTGTLQLTGTLGNRSLGLPFTLLLDRQGKLSYSHLGGLKASDLERKIRAELAH